MAGVAGAGTMGRGIAQVLAQGGARTLVYDAQPGAARKARESIAQALGRLAEKGRLSAADADRIVGRIETVDALDAFAPCHVVVEAIVEDLQAKRTLFSSLEERVQQDCILASNTSSLSVTAMAAACKRPGRVAGYHFFNPVPLMKLVEVVKTILTDDDVYEQAVDFGKKLGKVPVRAGDKTGFIVNRLLVPYMLDSIRALEEGVGSIVDIDNAMKLGCGYPMGPFTLGDFVGLDTTYYIAEIMFNEFREKRFAPPPLLKRMVLAGLYGRKSGRGFYDYTKDPKNPTPMNLV